MKVLAVSGSLRAASMNSALLRAAARVAAEIASPLITVLVYDSLRALPPFEPDLEVAAIDDPTLLPPAVVDFAAAVRTADAVVFSTPEYAHGVPGVLKNALDWVVGSGELVGKPVGLFHASGHGVFAQASLRETLSVMSAQLVPAASITCTSLRRSMTDTEILADEGTVLQLREALTCLSFHAYHHDSVPIHSTPTPECERATHAADRVRRSVHGPMWHGSAVNELLAGVTPRHAASRPIADAHSIWELVLHMTTWAEIANDRVHGSSLGDPPRSRDFPPVPVRPSARSWASARLGLTAAHAQLADTVAGLTEAALAEMVPSRTYTVGAMIDGVIEHTTYHGGQVALLRRALTANGAER